MSAIVDLTGQKFGRWTVLKRAEVENKFAHWVCKCECGAQKAVRGVRLRQGKSQSCGCLAKELARSRVIQHGQSKSDAYQFWRSMIRKYNHSGLVCERWLDFNHFLADMGNPDKGLMLGRIDNSAEFNVGNCVWIKSTKRPKLSFEDVLLRFSSNGLTVLSTECKSAKSPVSYKCKLGHTGQITPDSLYCRVKKGLTPCPQCSNVVYKLNESDVIEFVESQKYKLLDKFTNSSESLFFECPKGHKYRTNFSNFKRGKRCRECFVKSRKKTAVEQKTLFYPSDGAVNVDSLKFYEDLRKTGVYEIFCIANGKRYIGSAGGVRGFWGRWSGHLGELKKGDHHSQTLQRSWNKYGSGSFCFRIIEFADPSDCLSREQHWMDFFESYKSSNGFNITPTAGSNLGVTFSEEVRKKNSEARKGRKLSEEHKRKISQGLRGRRLSDEHIKKLRVPKKRRSLADSFSTL